jgi:cystathionine gamma-synthase
MPADDDPAARDRPAHPHEPAQNPAKEDDRLTDRLYPPPLALDPAWSPETVAVLAGRPARDPGAPMNPPIALSSTYIQDALLEYGRDGNAGWSALEAALGALDGGHAVTFGSGLAAATAIADLVPIGGTVALSTVVYHGVRKILDSLAGSGRLELRLVDVADTDAVVAATDGADMVWIESIANPLLVVADVPAIADAARAAGALCVVDATFATPLRQRPLALGADIVLHAVTKQIGGHSDLLLGAAVCKEPSQAERLAAFRHDHGSIPGALEAYLALRGLRTLAVRLDRSEATAAELARRLRGHPAIDAVHYPGLAGDSEFERATRVLSDGAGSMLSFEIKGSVEQTEAVLERLRVWAHATSLGGVESLIERRARYEGDAAIVGATLCRASVGLEHVEDLWADLDGALRSVLG